MVKLLSYPAKFFLRASRKAALEVKVEEEDDDDDQYNCLLSSMEEPSDPLSERKNDSTLPDLKHNIDDDDDTTVHEDDDDEWVEDPEFDQMVSDVVQSVFFAFDDKNDEDYREELDGEAAMEDCHPSHVECQDTQEEGKRKDVVHHLNPVRKILFQGNNNKNNDTETATTKKEPSPQNQLERRVHWKNPESTTPNDKQARRVIGPVSRTIKTLRLGKKISAN